MRTRLFAWSVLIGMALMVLPAEGQGSLSSQVLRLLTRDNTWSGINSFNNGSLLLVSAGSDPTVTTNKLYNKGGALYWNGALVPAASGTGTVTSVALTAPAIFTVAGSPVTVSGTLTLSLALQNANKVWSGPTTGGDATPTFRLLVDADVPDTITINGTNNVTWGSVNKAGSSLADLATRSAADLSSGTLPDARFPATLPVASGINLTALNATNLGSGTVPAARMPALTGDVTSTIGTVATTLANTAVTPGAYTFSSITVDAKGRITAASSGSPATGTVTHTAGALTANQLVIGNASADLKTLGSLGTTVTVLHGNAGGAPTFGAVALATDTTGTLQPAQGGLGITTVPSNGFVPIGNGTTYTAAALTGTANQVVVTNGAGSITLSTPQSIATTSTPQFLRLGLGAGADGTAALYTFGPRKYRRFDDGNSGTALTLDLSLADVRKITMTGNVTFTFNNPVTDTTYVFELIQDGTGSRTATWPGTVKWRGGSAPTLTVTAAKRDRVTCDWNGTNYYCDYQLNY